MTLSLGDFHTMAAEETSQASLVANRVVSATRQAARWIERNAEMQYMRRFVTFTVDASAEYPRTLPLPGKPDTDGDSMGFRSFGFVRFVLSDGSFHYLNYVDPRDVTAVESKRPTGFWMDGVDYLWFDNTPPEDYEGELYYVKYSAWPTDTSSTHWLLNNAEDVILGQTLIFLGSYLNEPEIKAHGMEMRTEGLATLLTADADLRSAHKDYQMVYQGG